MSWIKIVLIVVLAIGSALYVSEIGNDRKKITPGMAVAQMIINGLMIWAVVYA